MDSPFLFAAGCGLDAGSCETPYGLTLWYNYGNIKSYIDYVIKGREKNADRSL